MTESDQVRSLNENVSKLVGETADSIELVSRDVFSMRSRIEADTVWAVGKASRPSDAQLLAYDSFLKDAEDDERAVLRRSATPASAGLTTALVFIIATVIAITFATAVAGAGVL